MLRPRVHERDDRLVVFYPGGVALLWCVLTAIGLGFGIRAASSGDDPEATFIAFGLAAICVFVAWFALRSIVAADRTGLALLPVFGSHQSFRWHEVRAIGVTDGHSGRRRTKSLEVRASDDQQANVDGWWLGLSDRELRRIEVRLMDFARVHGGPAIASIDPDEDADGRDDVDELDGPEN